MLQKEKFYTALIPHVPVLHEAPLATSSATSLACCKLQVGVVDEGEHVAGEVVVEEDDEGDRCRRSLLAPAAWSAASAIARSKALLPSKSSEGASLLAGGVRMGACSR